jgi:hypothetical protein
MKAKLGFLALGFLLGAAAVYSAHELRPAKQVSEALVLTAPGVQVWYESSEDGSGFLNEFRARKLCGDAQKACGKWALVATTRSDRPYPAKDIEFATAGEKVLMHMPDGHAIKGELNGVWTVEGPTGSN